MFNYAESFDGVDDELLICMNVDNVKTALIRI